MSQRLKTIAAGGALALMLAACTAPGPSSAPSASAAPAAAFAPRPGQGLAPAQAFAPPLLRVRSPDAAQWVVVGAGRNGMAFGKSGQQPDETWIAQALTFAMPPASSVQADMEWFKQRVNQMNPLPRLTHTQPGVYALDNSRGYPCVHMQLQYKDHAAITRTGRQELLLSVIALYCRHPAHPNMGFFAAYTHRGHTPPDPVALRKDADAFIRGVQAAP